MAADMPGVAFEQPESNETHCLENIEMVQGLDRIFRATGIESAGRHEKRRKRLLVEPDE